MRPIKSAALIVNAKSRRGRALFARARELAESLPYPIDCHEVRNPALLPAAIDKAMAQKPDLVILGGGDGTISGLVDHLVGLEAALAVLPLGTANSFARTLGLPLTLEGAFDVIRAEHFRRIDLGMIDGDYFANCCAIGIAPLIAETVPHGLKAWAGRLGYLGWAAWKFLRFEPFTLILGEGEHERRIEVVEVRICNGSFHGGTQVIDSAEPDSGHIVVQAVMGTHKSRLAWNWFTSIFRLEARRATVEDFAGERLRLATEPPLAISIDGEVLAKTPVMVRVAKGVIEVAAPSIGTDSRGEPE